MSQGMHHARRGSTRGRFVAKYGVLWAGILLCGCSLAGGADLTAHRFRNWNSYELKNQFVQIEVTPQLGGRILGYQLNGHSFLWANPALQGQEPPPSHLGKDGSWLNWGGNKLWPAPQGWSNAKQWPGPPDPVLDGSPQEMKMLARSGSSVALELTSPKDPKTGIQFSRVIRIFNGSSRVHIVATMTNISNHLTHWGIWTVTQLDAGNRAETGWNPDYYTYAPINPQSHFPNGYRILFGSAGNPEIATLSAHRLLRLHYQWVVGKVGLDSRDGWLANLDGNSGYLFVQSFKFQPKQEYPDGSSLEVWTNGLGTIHAWGRTVHMQANPVDNPYIVESELLSPYASLAPGQQSHFSYDWYSTNVGGNYPILSCSDYGCSCRQFSAKRNGRRIYLSGRFGVFYEGRWAVELIDASGKVVGRRQPMGQISPTQPLVLHSIGVDAPENAVGVRLVIYRSATIRLGELATTAITE